MAGSHLISSRRTAERIGATSSVNSTSDDSVIAALGSKRDQAKAFIALLYRHNYGYSDLAQENIHLDLLKALYTELGISSHDERTVKIDQKISARRVSVSPPSTVLDLTHEDPPPSALQDQVDKAKESHPPTTLVSSIDNSKVPSLNAVAFVSNATETPSVPDTSPEVPKSAAVPTSSSTLTNTNEKPAVNDSRADYVARLKAARTSKSTESEKPVAAEKPAPPISKIPLAKPEELSHQVVTTQPKPELPGVKAPSPAIEKPEHNTETVEEEVTTAAQKKREAQTELARLKMEALSKSNAMALREEPPSSTARGIPGLTLISTPQQDTTSAGQVVIKESFESSSTSLGGRSRKRPVASDFDDAIPQPAAKKPFGQSRSEDMDEPIIIEASDDDTGNENEDAGVTVNEITKESKPVALIATAERSKTAVRDSPRLSDCLPRPIPSRQNTGLSSPAVGISPSLQTPGAITPGSARTPADLNKWNAKIDMMRKKIALMEQKKKLQKAETSRPQTPLKSDQPKSDGLLQSSPTAASSRKESGLEGASNQTLLGPAAQTPSSAGPALPPKEVLQLQTQQKTVPAATVEPKLTTLAHSSHQTALRASTSSPAIQSDSERKRRAEIRSKLSTYNATAEAKKARLEQLRREMEEIEEQTRKEEQEKADLAAELEQLGVDTEGMPREEMQAKKDEMIHQRELDVRVQDGGKHSSLNLHLNGSLPEAEPDSTEATDLQAPAQTQVQNSINETASNIVASLDHQMNDDNVEFKNESSVGQVPSVASESPRSFGDDAMVIDESSPNQSIEEGELSDGGGQLPDDPQEADRLRSPPVAQNATSSAALPVALSMAENPPSPEYEPPQAEQSSPRLNFTITAIGDISSSPASSSSNAQVEDSRAFQGEQTVNHSIVPYFAATDNFQSPEDEPTADIGGNAFATLPDQTTAIRSEEHPLGEDLIASAGVSAVVEQPASDLIPVASADTLVTNIAQAEQGPMAESETATGPYALEGEGHRPSFDGASAAMSTSDDDSDLYAQSSPGTHEVEQASFAGNEVFIAPAGTESLPAITIQPTPIVDDNDDDDDDDGGGDDDDDDDLYEPTDNLPITAPALIPESEPQNTSVAPVDNASSYDAESDGDAMDVVGSSDPDESFGASPTNILKLERDSDDVALEVRPSEEQQHATEEDISAVSYETKPF